MRRVDPNSIHDLGTDSRDCLSEGLLHGAGQDASGNGDTRQVRHLVRLDDNLLGPERTGARAEDEVERILGVHSQTADLGTVHMQRAGNVSSLLAVAVQTQRDQVSRGQLDRVPFQYDGSLGGIAAAQDGDRGLGGAEGFEDLVLKGREAGFGCGLGFGVARDSDVDDGARRNVGWEENGRELDLAGFYCQLKGTYVM